MQIFRSFLTYCSAWGIGQDSYSWHMLKCYHSTPILNSDTLYTNRKKMIASKEISTTVKLWINRVRINALFKWQIYILYEWIRINTTTFWVTIPTLYELLWLFVLHIVYALRCECISQRYRVRKSISIRKFCMFSVCSISYRNAKYCI